MNTLNFVPFAEQKIYSKLEHLKYLFSWQSNSDFFWVLCDFIMQISQIFPNVFVSWNTNCVEEGSMLRGPVLKRLTNPRQF